MLARPALQGRVATVRHGRTRIGRDLNSTQHPRMLPKYTSQEFDEYCPRPQHPSAVPAYVGITRSRNRSSRLIRNSSFTPVRWPNIDQLKTATFSWIETYYNRTRRHSTLNYLTPSEYELGFRDIHELAA